MNVGLLTDVLRRESIDIIEVHSQAADRAEYLRRPDLGRALDRDSLSVLAENASRGKDGAFDLAIVIADGLSATAVALNAVPMAKAIAARERNIGRSVAPVAIATQARVALGDPIGEHLGARCVVMLIGERPGLSASDSLGCYITFGPRSGLPDSRRNCISNIRQAGLSVEAAVEQVASLLDAMFDQKISGITLQRPEGLKKIPASV